MDGAFDTRIAAVAATQHGIVTAEQARATGATRAQVRHRLRTGRWSTLHPGVFAIGGSSPLWRRAGLAAVLAAGVGAAGARLMAAAFLGIPGFAEDAIDVLVPRGRARPVAGARVSETSHLPAHHVRMVDGVPVTTVARTLFDLAGSVHPARAERALDNALSRRLVTVPSCWRVLDELAEHGRVGTLRFRAFLEARSGDYVAPASELERRLLRLLADHGLPPPEREIDVGDRDGWVGRVELHYRECGLLIEADSRRHHSSLLDRRADRARDNRLMADGYRVLRFVWHDVVERPAWVADTIRQARAVRRPAA